MKLFRVSIRTLAFSYSVRVNCNPENKRQRLAHLLRNLASMIDGRTSLAVEISSTPELSLEQKNECIRFGSEAIGKSVALLARSEALEEEMKKVAPLLFEENSL